MKRFRFPLEAALHLREARLEAEEAKLGAIHAELEAVRQSERDLRAELEESASVSGEGEPDAFLLSMRDRFRQGAQQKLIRLSAAAEQIGRRIVAQQEVVTGAKRDRELLIKLKNKARSEWQKEVDKELDAIADEAYLSRWNR